MLSRNDTAVIYAEPALVKSDLLRDLCSSYGWALSELSHQRQYIESLELQLNAYRTWLKTFMEVCPPPENEKSARELVEKLLKGGQT